MKREDCVLFVNVFNEIVCGDGSFKATAHHQLIVSDEGVDVEVMGVDHITFMGMPIEGYQEFKKFKEKMKEMGINIDKMVDDACEGLISQEFIDECKNKFKRIMD